MVERIGVVSKDGSGFAHGQWNPGKDAILHNQPSIRIGVALLESEKKTFTEILAHEIGHQFEKFLTKSELDVLEGIYKKKLLDFEKKNAFLSSKGKQPKKLPYELTDSSEYWAVAIQNHESSTLLCRQHPFRKS